MRDSSVESGRRIYVDLDDVVCETVRGFLEVLLRDFGKVVEVEEIHSFDLGESLDLDPQELASFMRSAHEPEVLMEMEPVDGAIEVLEEWRKAGNEVQIVTGRPPDTFETSRRWLASRRIPHDDLTFVDKYSRELAHLPGAPRLQLEDLAPMGFSLAVEDSLTVAKYLVRELGIEVLLLDKPWNRQSGTEESSLDGKLRRCADWEEIRARCRGG